jgi:hypothetical protein
MIHQQQGKQRDDYSSRERAKKREGKEYRLGEKIVNKKYF